MTPVDLVAARKALNLSQKQLAEVLGIHVTILNRWENGRAKIPPYLHLIFEHCSQCDCTDMSDRFIDLIADIVYSPTRGRDIKVTHGTRVAVDS